MLSDIVQSDRAVTLVGGGAVEPAWIEGALRLAPVLVAADGGANVALSAGLLPEAVIGDLDSLGEDARRDIPADRLHRVREQDSTDFEKCLARIRAPFVLALGFSGPRADHMMAVWNTLVRLPAPPCIVLGQADLVFAAPAGRVLSLDLAAGTRLSLFPLAPVTGRGQGLRWPIEGIDFAPDGRIGTSNAATGPVELEFDGAGMLVILPRECLGAAIAAVAAPHPGA